jgi:predicted DNA-binding protein with PD1-like motif
MRVIKNGDIFMVRLEIGEEFVDTVTRFAARQNLPSASLSGIGALRDFEVGYYRLNRKEYKREKFTEIVELLSCVGNISTRDGKHFSHIHVCLGREDYSVMGGHLFSGIVAVTAEIFLRPLPESISRAQDETTGLALLDLPLGKAL